MIDIIKNYQASKRRKELRSKAIDLLQKLDLISHTDEGTLGYNTLVSKLDKTIGKLTGDIQLTDEEIIIFSSGVAYALREMAIYGMATSLSYAGTMKEATDWINEYMGRSIGKFVEGLRCVRKIRAGVEYHERRSDIPIPEKWKDNLDEHFRTENTTLHQEISKLTE